MNDMKILGIFAVFLICLVGVGSYELSDLDSMNRGSLFDGMEKGEFYSYESNAIEYENDDRVDITWTYVNPYEESTKFKVEVEFADFSKSSEFTLEAFGDKKSETFQFLLNSTPEGTYPCTLRGYVYDDEFNLYQTLDLGDIVIVESKNVTTYVKPTLTINTVPTTTDIAYKYDTIIDVESPTAFTVPRNNVYKFSVIAEGYEPYTFETNIGDASETVDVNLVEVTPKTNEFTIDFNVEDQNEQLITDAIVFVEGVKYPTTNGYASIDVPNGEVTVVIMKDGYQSFVHTYTVDADAEYTITMNKIGLELQAIVIEPATTTPVTTPEPESTPEVNTTATTDPVTTNENTTEVQTVTDTDVTVEGDDAATNYPVYTITLLIIGVLGFLIYKKKN